MKRKTAIQVSAHRLRRLVMFAQAVAGPLDGLTPDLFVEDAEGPSPLRWELGEFGKLDRRLTGTAPEEPSDYHGFFRWRLSPTHVASVPSLDAKVVDALRKACSRAQVSTCRKTTSRSLRYRFLVRSEHHAHVGVLVFIGPRMERILSRALLAGKGGRHEV